MKTEELMMKSNCLWLHPSHFCFQSLVAIPFSYYFRSSRSYLQIREVHEELLNKKLSLVQYFHFFFFHFSQHLVSGMTKKISREKCDIYPQSNTNSLETENV